MRKFIHAENRSALGSAMGLALAAHQAARQPPENVGIQPSRGREFRIKPQTLGKTEQA